MWVNFIKIMKKFSIFCALVTLLLSCESAKPGQTIIDGLALGTTYHIVICEDTIRGTKAAINQCFDQVNASMSLYNKDSRLSQINRNETLELDSMLSECISQALRVSAQTLGMYDITIKPLTDAWGFAKEQKTEHINVDSLLEFVGYQKISIKNNKLIKQNLNTQLDLNSIAKGSTVDIVAQTLEEMGYKNYLVEIGGEIFARGVNAHSNHWRIGIDRPEDGNYSPGVNLQNILSISDMAMATSGNYRRFYLDDKGNKIVHTINPKTGLTSPSNLLSATVITENCAMADAYATALMSMGLEEAKEFDLKNPKVLVYLIYSDDSSKMQTYASEQLTEMIE